MLISKFKSILDNDKVKHFIYGLAMTGMLVPFGWMAALGFVFSIAVIKEVIDERQTRGSFSPADIGSTVISVPLLYFWYELIEKLSAFM